MHAEVENFSERLRVKVTGAGTVVDEVDSAHVCVPEDRVAGAIMRGTMTGRLVGG